MECFGWSYFDSGDIILLAISMVVGLYVGIKGVGSLCQNKKISKYFKISYWLMIILYFIVSIGFFFNLVFDHHFKNFRFVSDPASNYDKSELSLLRYAVNDSTFFSYFAMLILLFTVLIARLVHTFRDSVYKMSKCRANIFYFITIFVAINVFIGFGLSGSQPMIGGLLQTFCGFMYLISSGVMVIIFIKKLNSLILTTYDHNGMQDIESIQLNEMQTELINSATKYLVLTFIGFLSTFLSILMNITIRFVASCILHRVFFVWTIKMDIMINMICFYLQFSFSKNDYKRWCFCFDNMLKRNMRNTTILEMKHTIERESKICTVSTPTLGSSSPTSSGGRMHSIDIESMHQ